jgi:bifunctional DNA-binding transcriptional regulator/antitoxin component of YhaV-PrlF toxin-antitoxin module
VPAGSQRLAKAGSPEEYPYADWYDHRQVQRQRKRQCPSRVRTAFDLNPGDQLCYESQGGRVILARGRRGSGDSFKTFSEGIPTADRRAHAEL